MTRTITAYFDSRAEAQAAADRLVEAGIAGSDLSIHDSSTTGTTTTTSTAEDKGFWASLGDLFMPDEDRYAYSEGIRRGGSVLTVRADEVEFDRVSDILEEAGSVDLDTRETEWRSQGWSGYGATTSGSTMGAVTGGYSAETRTGTTTDETAAGGAYATGATTDREDYIPVAKEELRVGKREVDHGRVRIRSYVVETPVEEHVSLREETVSLDRRPVDRAATSADHLFQDRTIEAEERGEEAVIAKETRVVEEVRLSKDVVDRDETIRDTVKHTEVEVDDERIAGSTTLTEEERRRRGL